MLYCKGCECIIVPGRAFLAAGGYYCPHCIEHMNPTMRGSDGGSVSFDAPADLSREHGFRDDFSRKEVL